MTAPKPEGLLDLVERLDRQYEYRTRVERGARGVFESEWPRLRDAMRALLTRVSQHYEEGARDGRLPDETCPDCELLARLDAGPKEGEG